MLTVQNAAGHAHVRAATRRSSCSSASSSGGSTGSGPRRSAASRSASRAASSTARSRPTSTVYYPSLVFALVIVALLVKPEGLFTRRRIVGGRSRMSEASSAAIQLLGPMLVVVAVGIVSSFVSRGERHLLPERPHRRRDGRRDLRVRRQLRACCRSATISFIAVGAFSAGVMTIPLESKSGVLPDLFPILRDHTIGNVPSLILAAALGGLLAFLLGLPLMRLSGLAASIATFGVLQITLQPAEQLDVDRAGRDDALARARVHGWRPGRRRRPDRDRDRVRLPAEPVRPHAARHARGCGRRAGRRRRRAPPAAVGLHALGRAGGIRGRAVRAHARLDHGQSRSTSISRS